jgi:hypothetical protein
MYTMMLWLKKIGPITGILERNGISIGENAIAEFQVDWYGMSNFL